MSTILKSLAQAKRQVWAEIDRTRQQVIDRCLDLVRIPSENPPGDTRQMAQHSVKLLESRGIRVEVFEPRPTLVSLVAHLRPFERSKPTFVLNGHMDTFPVGDPKEWSTPPFEPFVRDGKIFGKGVVDMKSGLTGSLSAFLALHELDVPLAGNLILMMVADEETLDKWGTGWILEKYPEYRGIACITGEPGHGDAGVVSAINLGGKGILWLRITVKGEAYHGGLCEGPSAITRCGEVFRALEGLHGMKGDMPAELADVVAESRTLKARNRTLEQVTTTVNVNVGVIHGGTKVNVVPSRATMEVDIRLPLGWTADRMLALVKQRLADSGVGECEIEVFNSSTPYYLSPQDRLVQVVNQNVRGVYDRPAQLRLLHATADNRFFRHYGIPAVDYGCPGYSGRPDEFTLVDSLIGVTKVHAGSVMDMLGIRD